MIPHPVGVPADVDDVAVVDQPVDQRGGHHLVWDPTWTVIELATGREHGPFDSEADVALCLAFEKLARDQVEIVTDASPMASMTSWS